MSIAYRLIQQLRDGMSSGGEGDDLYSAGVESALDMLESGGDLDSGAVGDRLRKAVGNWQQKRGTSLAQRGAGNLAKVNGPAAPIQQQAAAVAQVQIGAEARRAINKSRFKLYRMIPLIPPAPRATTDVVAIAVTPTSNAFGESITCNGIFRIDSLIVGGQTFTPNGAISSAPFQGANNGNLPINTYLKTVPITGQITNNTGASVYATMDLLAWMEDDSASERY